MLPQRHFSKREPPSGTPSGPGIYFSYARSVAVQKRARVTLSEFLSALAVGFIGGGAGAVLYASQGLPYRALSCLSCILGISVGTLALRPVLAGLSAKNFEKPDKNGARED